MLSLKIMFKVNFARTSFYKFPPIQRKRRITLHLPFIHPVHHGGSEKSRFSVCVCVLNIITLCRTLYVFTIQLSILLKSSCSAVFSISIVMVSQTLEIFLRSSCTVLTAVLKTICFKYHQKQSQSGRYNSEIGSPYLIHSLGSEN